MGPKVKQINLCTQANKFKLVLYSKTGLESMGIHKYRVDPCLFYIKDSVILTCVDDFLIVSYKNDTITPLVESLNNGPENYLLIDEEDISNYIGVKINKNSDGTF